MMCAFDHSLGGYPPQFRQITGGFDERFDHFAGGIRYMTTSWGVLANSTVLRGVIALNFKAIKSVLQYFDQCPGG